MITKATKIVPTKTAGVRRRIRTTRKEIVNATIHLK